MLAPSLLLLALACGDDPTASSTDSGDPAATDSGATAAGAVGHCTYVNPFSQGDECKEYLGSGWDLDSAAADCQAPVVGADAGAFVADSACARDDVLAECIVDADGELHNVIVFPGDAPDACGGAELGCGFAGGEFVPGDTCAAGESAGVAPDDAFQPFEQVCMDPVADEPPGDGPDGQVCTWQAISGATEEGRAFEDYADCDVVRTQRPYWAYAVDYDTPDDDPRLDDDGYMAELDWATRQVQASACVCCHSSELAPDGPSGWYLEAGPLWVDTLDDDGLAMMAGWVDSTAFGAFPAADNNGFSRDVTGTPTTDPERMQAFLEGELDRRGLDRDDFADTEPFGGVLYDQLFFEPSACENGEGVAADGTVTWTGGPARYLYVLDADAMSPGVPPNLDTPDGTLWRLDVAASAWPIESGAVGYGGTADGTTQVVPADAAPPALTPGESYYLVALLDIYQPATRCLFTAE